MARPPRPSFWQRYHRSEAYRDVRTVIATERAAEVHVRRASGRERRRLIEQVVDVEPELEARLREIEGQPRVQENHRVVVVELIVRSVIVADLGWPEIRCLQEALETGIVVGQRRDDLVLRITRRAFGPSRGAARRAR